jgi:hypothetical protein
MATLPSSASRPRSARAWPTKITITPANARQEAPMVRLPTSSPSSTAARYSAISGAMKASAIACASGTWPIPQKNSRPMKLVSTPRSMCIRRTRRSGQRFQLKP